MSLNKNSDLLDPAAVGINDSEFKITARNFIVWLGYFASQFQNQSCQRVTLSFYFIKSSYRQIHGLTDIIKHSPSFKNIGAIFLPMANPFVLIKLILYVANYLFHDIFKCNDAAGTPKLVDYNRKMDAIGLKILQKVFNHLMLVHKIGCTKQAMPIELIRFI